MSNSEMSAERGGHMDPIEAGDDGRDELKSMLDTIAAQLQDADRRHTAALDEMQNRISGMGREADTLRARIPDQFAPAFEQIEAGIGELALRLADTGNGQRTVDRSAGHPGSAPGVHSHAFDPWNQDDADALAGPDGVAGTASHHAGSDTSNGSRIDEAWLESRFAEIARGIEYSLAHVKPESGLSEFGERLDQFEAQFAKAFGGSANHDDLSAVRQIGAHMEAVVLRLEKTSDQLERLNTIESQLASVSRTLADMQASASHAKSADIDAVARAVAEETAQRFAARHADDRNSAADELRPLIQQLMTESRQGGEQTAALLDTMQQAMVRLLDRAEAIEFTSPPPLRDFEPEPPVRFPGFGGGPEMFGSDVFLEEDLMSGGKSHAFGETRTAAAYSGTAAPHPLSEPYDRELSPEEMAVRSEKLRQEFIADARRAQARLTAEGDLSASSLPSQSRGTKPTAGGSRPIRRSTSAPANTSGPTAPSPRLMIVAGLVLVALAGLWYTFGFDNRANPVATHQLPQQEGTAAGTSDAVKSAPTGSKQPSALPAPDGNGPRGDLAPGGDDHSQNTASNDEASQPRTTLPMLGVAVDLNDQVSEAEVQQARRHQAMANLSGELGNAAARPGEAALVPASMVPTEAETEGAGTQGQNDAPPVGATQSSPIDMPPAMIGPLSFRAAASKGDPSAEFEVGARFAEGEGVKQDFAEAAKWYQRSADQGFAQAQYRLATLYERGLGLKADRGQAANWYLLAAKQGNIKAMHNLAVLSANQTDRSPDYTSAAQWFEEAAKRGLPDSQFNLAVLYENGLGVTRNLKTAFMWLSLAARAGDADATRRRDILRAKLTAEEIAETDKLVAAWTIMPTDRTINDALVAGELWKKNPKNGLNG